MISSVLGLIIFALVRKDVYAQIAKNPWAPQNLDRLKSFNFEQSELPNIKDLISFSTKLACPDGPEYQCCRNFKNLTLHTQARLIDNSGTYRSVGLSLGNIVSDGRYHNCKRQEENFNYCRFRNGYGRQILHCLPEDCDVDSLNLYLDLINSDTQIIQGNYSTCYDPNLWWHFTWYEITGYVCLILWTTFLCFSPWKSLKIDAIAAKTFSNHQPEAALKSLNGMRVLSLMWVMAGHFMIFLNYKMPENIREIYREIGEEHPWLFVFSNGSFSVDSFFVMGGVLTGYLMMRKFGQENPQNSEKSKNSTSNSQKFTWKNLSLAVLNRTLRLTPTIIAAIINLIVFVGHHGKIDDKNQSRIGWLLDLGTMSAHEQADACKDKWYWTVLNLVWMDVTDGMVCLGHLWYVSAEFWYFILSLVLMKISWFSFSAKDGKSPQQRITYYFYLPIIALSVVSHILCFVMNFLTQFPWQAMGMFQLPYENVTQKYQDNDWMLAYIYPWYRVSPYFIGLIGGIWLAQAKAAKKMVGKSTRVLMIFLSTFGLAVCLFFPLPNVYTLFWPAWVSFAYPSIVRLFWGIFLTILIYYMELSKKGWIYNILAYDNWLLLSKVNFSAYLIHYGIIPVFIDNFIFEAVYVSALFELITATGFIVFIYFIALIFHMLVEAPISVGCRKLMEVIQSRE